MQEKIISFLNAVVDTNNYTVEGKCSNCGECCSNLLPLTQGEINQIHKYIKIHHIKENKKNFPTAEKVFDGTCPFRNNGKRICEIYSIRPLICKFFQCNKWGKQDIKEAVKLSKESRRTVDMREEFFGKV